MYILIRTGRIAAGKAQRAREVAKELAAYATDELGVKTELLSNIGGDQWEVHWMIRFDSLDQMTQTLANAHADEGHNAIAAQMSQEMLFANVSDRIYKVIS